jgi:quinol monooxygenase YgiN
MYIWEYLVRADCVADFLRAYGPGGAWVQLFRKAKGYVRTELYQDHENPLRFVTIDQWVSQISCAAFRIDFAAEFESLDTQCENYTETERQIGSFSRVG